MVVVDSFGGGGLGFDDGEADLEADEFAVDVCGGDDARCEVGRVAHVPHDTGEPAAGGGRRAQGA